MSTQSPPRISFEEYLDREAHAQIKSEYHRGEVFAMEGATAEHAELCIQLAYLLKQRLQGKCRIFDSSLNLYVPGFDQAFYPDILR